MTSKSGTEYIVLPSNPKDNGEGTTGNFSNSEDSDNTRSDDDFSGISTNQIDDRDGSGSGSGSSCNCNFIGWSILDTNISYDILCNDPPKVMETKMLNGIELRLMGKSSK